MLVTCYNGVFQGSPNIIAALYIYICIYVYCPFHTNFSVNLIWRLEGARVSGLFSGMASLAISRLWSKVIGFFRPTRCPRRNGDDTDDLFQETSNIWTWLSNCLWYIKGGYDIRSFAFSPVFKERSRLFHYVSIRAILVPTKWHFRCLDWFS